MEPVLWCVGNASEHVCELGLRINVVELWLLGTFRDNGSVHSDFWSGSAADLAERDAIGVFLVGG